MRHLLERLARSRVIRRRLPSSYGRRTLYVTPDSALALWLPNLGRQFGDLLSAADRFVSAGDKVWDIGANVGIFAFAAAHRAGPKGSVVAVEADPFLASLLQRSKGHDSNADVHTNVICTAIGDRECISEFMISARGRSSNSLAASGHRSQAGGTRSVQHVPTTTLDSLLETFAPPDVVKIDVEGAESMVLEGARRLLTEHRPKIYIEVGPKQNEDVTKQLLAAGYCLYDGDQDGDKELDRCTYNTLAVPQEADWPQHNNSIAA